MTQEHIKKPESQIYMLQRLKNSVVDELKAYKKASIANPIYQKLTVQPPPSRPASGAVTENSKNFRKFSGGGILPSVCKRSEAFLEIHHLRRLGAKPLLSVLRRS